MTKFKTIPELASELAAAGEENARLRAQLQVQDLKLHLWSATFSKYSSFKANGVKSVSLSHVIIDFNKCDNAYPTTQG